MPAPCVRPLTARRVVLAAIFLAGALALAGCSGDGGGGGTGASAAPVTGVTSISTKGVKFSPASVKVPVGTTLTWSFDDGPVPHDVKGDGLDSGRPRKSGTFTHAFTTAGTFAYHCSIHPNMTGQVVVG
jgi:plastocyanin